MTEISAPIARLEPGSVSVLLAHALLDAAEAQGARRQSLQAAAGCVFGERDRVDAWIDLGRFSRLLEVAIEQTGDPAFGLHWGERSPLSNFGLIASLGLCSRSPQTALATLTRFQGLLFQGSPLVTFLVGGQTAIVRFDLSAFEREARRAWADFVVAGTLVLVRQLGGRSRTNMRVSFEHAAPPYREEYQRILGDRLSFESKAFEFEFDAAQLDLTQPMFNERLSEAVQFEASCALARLADRQRCSARVREELVFAWPATPTMAGVARKLGMSTRTLRRHLQQEGTAFPNLVAEALRNRALRLLSDPQASVKEVAYALGFANSCAFHRAFKRWTGRSPSEIRARRAALAPPRSVG